MAPRAVTRKCSFCSKSCDRANMTTVPTSQTERESWFRRLGAVFRANCEKTAFPYVCISHFPPRKSHSRKSKVLPYKNGTRDDSKTRFDIVDDEEQDDDDYYSEDDIDPEGDSSDFDSESDDCDEPSNFQNFICAWKLLEPVITICYPCIAKGTKNYATANLDKRGASLRAQMKCDCGHEWKWNSSPVLDSGGKRGPKTYQHNIMLSSALILTGSGYSQMRAYFHLLSMPFPSKSRHHQISKTFLTPAVDSAYEINKNKVFGKLQEFDGHLNLAGDAQYDSRGFSAYVCRYSIMHVETSLIIDFSVCRKERGGSSAALEKEAFKELFPRLIEELKDSMQQDDPVATLTTDRCSNISAAMKEYPSVKHLFDGWHFIRSIRREIYKHIAQRQFQSLKPWVKHLVNHVYFSIQKAEGDGQKAYESILTFFFHVRNIHSNFKELEWEDKKNKKKLSFKFETMTSCSHDLDSRNSSCNLSSPPYLDISKNIEKKGFDTLLGIILEPTKRRDIESVSPFLSTSCLESYHSLATGYSPKEKFFDKQSYILRSKVSILHWNNLRIEEMCGMRREESRSKFYCKTRKVEVDKVRKTRSKHLWRQEVMDHAIRLCSRSDHNNRTAEDIADEIEINSRAQAEAAMYAEFFD